MTCSSPRTSSRCSAARRTRPLCSLPPAASEFTLSGAPSGLFGIAISLKWNTMASFRVGPQVIVVTCIEFRQTCAYACFHQVAAFLPYPRACRAVGAARAARKRAEGPSAVVFTGRNQGTVPPHSCLEQSPTGNINFDRVLKSLSHCSIRILVSRAATHLQNAPHIARFGAGCACAAARARSACEHDGRSLVRPRFFPFGCANAILSS